MKIHRIPVSCIRNLHQQPYDVVYTSALGREYNFDICNKGQSILGIQPNEKGELLLSRSPFKGSLRVTLTENWCRDFIIRKRRIMSDVEQLRLLADLFLGVATNSFNEVSNLFANSNLTFYIKFERGD